MKVLIACEYSGRVRDAFIAKGHDAISCDFLPTDSPGPHYQGDVFDLINWNQGRRFDFDDGYGKTVSWFANGPKGNALGFDLMIAHPPCTYFTVAAAWALKDPDFEKYPGVGYHQRVKPETLTGAARRKAQKEALDFVIRLLNAKIDKIAIENPVGQLSTLLRKPDQTIQPNWFGDASKATCLWLKNLQPLVKTNEIKGRLVNGKERWGNQTDSGQNKLSPSEDRWKERSRTYEGIARAWAEQWGSIN